MVSCSVCLPIVDFLTQVRNQGYIEGDLERNGYSPVGVYLPFKANCTTSSIFSILALPKSEYRGLQAVWHKEFAHAWNFSIQNTHLKCAHAWIHVPTDIACR